MTLKEMKERWKTFVKPEDYPDKPQHTRNWENFFLVILRDAGKVGIIDGDTKEVISKVDTGYAVHVMKESSDGPLLVHPGTRRPHDQDRFVDGPAAGGGRNPDRLGCA